MSQSFLSELGLGGSIRFHRDPLFWAAVGAGGLVALAIWLWIPVQPVRGLRQILRLLWTTGILYPLLEELVFRGALQGWLLARPWAKSSRLGISGANLVTTAAFTALHFLNHSPLWAASVVMPSLVFGFFRDRAGNVYPSLALHVLYNLFYLMAAVAS